MIAPASRRGFLRGLTTLPLIGGGVTLIGAPSAVAEPCTDALLERYCAFLAAELREAMVERRGRRADMTLSFLIERGACSQEQARHWRGVRLADYREDVNIGWAPKLSDVSLRPLRERPTKRAALVLSAVGCDWREGGL